MHLLSFSPLSFHPQKPRLHPLQHHILMFLQGHAPTRFTTEDINAGLMREDTQTRVRQLGMHLRRMVHLRLVQRTRAPREHGHRTQPPYLYWVDVAPPEPHP